MERRKDVLEEDRASTQSEAPRYDVVVVGGGTGGIYAVHQFTEQGLSVLGIEAAPDVGGVWYHNAYPGARVDLESYYYCYMFDPDLYREWKWSDRYASQSELLAYLNHVADKYDIRRHYRFNTWMNGATWDPERSFYTVTTDSGDAFTCRYLVLTAGQLSSPRDPDFEGLEDFRGERVQTSRWPRIPIEFRDRRVGVIGTGSSGVQVVTELSDKVEHLYVFQRTAHYSVPAHNGPMDREFYDQLGSRVHDTWGRILRTKTGTLAPPVLGKASDYDEAEQQRLLEERWAFGGQSMIALFADQGTDHEANTVVSEFVRAKIRDRVNDPEVAEKLVPTYPIGVRRVAVDTGYYESFNRENVTLVDVKADPIKCITPTGIQTQSARYDLDVIIFAIGFVAFFGPLDQANVRNEYGKTPRDGWTRGPQTYLGLMTSGFPNLFLITGPGATGVLANVNATNVQQLDFVADMIRYMKRSGYVRVEADEDAQRVWTDHVNEVSEAMIRRQVDNYMVHVNHDDNTRIFMPYAAGFDRYVKHCDDVIAASWRGFNFS